MRVMDNSSIGEEGRKQRSLFDSRMVELISVIDSKIDKEGNPVKTLFITHKDFKWKSGMPKWGICCIMGNTTKEDERKMEYRIWRRKWKHGCRKNLIQRSIERSDSMFQ